MTIQEIRKKSKAKAPYFFNAKTLRFFGQTMSSFDVYESPKGNIYIVAAIQDRDGKHQGFTFRQFINDDLRHVTLSPENRNLETIEKYIAEN